MISHKTIQQLCNLLAKIVYQEQRIDSAREVLAEQVGFEPYAAFQRIDRSKSGIIRAQNLQGFLYENQTEFPLEDINVYIEHFDEDKKGGLYYYEFLRNLLPFKNTVLRSEISQKDTFQVKENEQLPYKVEYAIATVIKKTIFYIKDLDQDKIELNSRPDFSASNAFNLIDKKRSGSITHTTLKYFLESQGFDLDDVEIQMLITSFDVNMDNKIDENEFVFSIQPRYPSSKFCMLKKSQLLSSPCCKSKLKTQFDSYAQPSNIKTFSNYKQNTDINESLHKSKEQIEENLQKYQYYNQSSCYRSPYLSLNSPSKAYTSVKKLELSPTPRTSQLLTAAQSPSKYSSKKKVPKGSKTDFYMQSFITEQQSRSLKSIKLQFELKNGVQNEEKELAKMFKVFLQQDQKIEDFKIRLASCQEFNLLDLFQCFDQDNNNYISFDEFSKQLKIIGVKLPKEQVKVFFKRYIRHGIKQINFKDFSSIFLPSSLKYRKIILAKDQTANKVRDELRIKELFDRVTISLIAFILESSVLNECNNEDLRIKLFSKKHLNFKNLFLKYDQNKDGIWEIGDLVCFVEQNEMCYSEQQIQILFQRLDKNYDDQVLLKEFTQEIQPSLFDSKTGFYI